MNKEKVGISMNTQQIILIAKRTITISVSYPYTQLIPFLTLEETYLSPYLIFGTKIPTVDWRI
jgi:hypothetical protein